MRNFGDWLAGCLFVFFMVVIVYTMFFLTPRSAYIDRECLFAGYPKSTITYLGEGFCMNLEGTVTVKVDRVK